ncbi:RNA binding protein [Peziza echinospora]|nr:RNA binding protein [Peziza echinospora]
MDRSLDEVVRERQTQRRSGDRTRGPRGGGRRGVRKPERNENSAPRNGGDSRGAWVHDRYDDNDVDAPVSSRGSGHRQNGFGAGARRGEGSGRERDDNRVPPGGARLRVENIHYELGQEDLVSLFTRIAPPISVVLKYDRAGRSEGIAYVTYERESHALRAIDEFDRANAHGQPIFLTLVPTSAPAGSGRSLFDRVEAPPAVRSHSPDRGVDGADYRGDGRVKPSGRGSKIDRYIPSDRGSDTRDRGGSGYGRDRPIVDRPPRREGRRGDGETRRSGARPKKTVEELDDEMSNYWAGAADADGNAGGEEALGHDNRGAADVGGDGMAEDDMMVE